jgi:hypothetical protein
MYGLDDGQKQQLTQVLDEFKEIFSDFPGRTDLVDHDIELIDDKPIRQHPYRMHPEKLKYLKKEVDEMLDLGLIERSSSSYSSPVVMVPKPDNTLRVCIDYRKLNAVTKPDCYPIPRVDDLIDKVSSATYLTKFDLRKGYYQCSLTESAKSLTAFITPFGLYQFRVMPFGFQRLMNLLSKDMPNCATYIDDICLFDNDWESHLKNVTEFLNRLKQAGLTANLAKCQFGKTQITYLGHTVGQGEVKPKQANIKAILEFPPPTSKREIKRFLGMIGFYRKFVNNFATIAEPLTRLLKKTQKMVWSEDCQTVFEELKAVLHNPPVLRSPDFTKPFKVAVDASDIGTGAVLLQEGNGQVDHPIAYMSKKLNSCEKNYSTIEKECLALVWAVERFQIYFGSNPVVIFTDHNPLVFINKSKGTNRRILRWSFFLQQFNLDIRHIAGKDNVLADTLSRI